VGTELGAKVTVLIRQSLYVPLLLEQHRSHENQYDRDRSEF
jgi:hypothetical protein